MPLILSSKYESSLVPRTAYHFEKFFVLSIDMRMKVKVMIGRQNVVRLDTIAEISY